MSHARRPLRSRDARWARALAARLAARAVPPNAISVASVGFAAIAAGCLAAAPALPPPWRVGLTLAAAVAIQLRLLANLLDGLVAVEGGLGRPSGPFFNEFPDRLADVLVLVGAGYGAGHGGVPAALGWAAAVAALLTAYVRLLGRVLGVGERFDGPMAKPHRMAVLTVGCLAAAVEAVAGWPPRALAAALAIVTAGAAWTTARRARAVLRALDAASAPAPPAAPVEPVAVPPNLWPSPFWPLADSPDVPPHPSAAGRSPSTGARTPPRARRSTPWPT